jgi:putative transposase
MLATPRFGGVASTSTWKEFVVVANFKQILAMCLDGASYGQITHTLGCSRREVSRAKKVITDEGLTSEIFRQLPPGWFDEQFGDGRSKRSLSYDQPDFQALARKMKSTKHVTRHKLWMDYLSQPCPTGKTKYQYSQFCSGLNEFLRANDLVEVITHEPGQELYVDWAGDKVPVVDQASGDTAFKASLFVAVNPYSGLMYVTAAANEKMPAWIECHVKALNYLGKIPAVIVPDNAPTATYRPKKNSTYRMVTDRYAAFADYYGVTIVPTRPGRPRDKAAVERAVKIVYTKILGYFGDEVFYSLNELNEAIAYRLADINDTMTRADGTTRDLTAL